MKNLKLFAIAAPLATCAYYSILPNSPKHKEHSLIAVPSVVQASEHEMTLRHVQVVFRHGARAPVAWSKSRFDHRPQCHDCEQISIQLLYTFTLLKIKHTDAKH